MWAWLVVGIGGAIGSVARHGVNRWVHGHWPALRFPVSTVVVNLLGCCVIGALTGLVVSARLPMRAHWREFVFVGLIGGFTTFSTFGLDTVTLLRTGAAMQAFLNVAVQVTFGIGGVYAAMVLCERLGR